MVKKRLRSLGMLLIVMVMAVSFTACSTNSDSDNDTKTENASAKDTKPADSGDADTDGDADQTDEISVAVSINADSAKDAGYDINTDKEVKVKKDATVMDALDASGISYSGSGYVQEIEGLAEKAVNDQSGWTYTVNGESVQTAADQTKLKDGDKVEWEYVTSWE